MVPEIPAERLPIETLRAISELAMAQPDYRASKYRKHREAWVLCQFATLYNRWSGATTALMLAEPGDSERIPADFAMYGTNEEYVVDIETTELTDAWDWWRPGTAIPLMEDPWKLLPELIQKKREKDVRYREPTWLLIYDNVSSGIYQLFENVGFGARSAARDYLKTGGISWSNISGVWVLNSDGRRAGRITGQPVDLRVEC